MVHDRQYILFGKCSLAAIFISLIGYGLWTAPSAVALPAPPTTQNALNSDPPIATTSSTESTATSKPALSKEKRRQLIAEAERLFWGVVIFFVLIIAASAIIVFTRVYRTYLIRDSKTPTPDDDVWQMHRLPKELRSAYGLSDDEPRDPDNRDDDDINPPDIKNN